MKSVKERFLDYIVYDTQSVEGSASFPSSQAQLHFGQKLVIELLSLGVADAAMDENGYVTGTIPANIPQDVPVLGFIAHMDTSPDCSGKDVRARVVECYDGGDIVLNEEKGIVMRPAEFESLRRYIGQDLIVTDGTTLLGADDKAGVAEIMTMAQTLLHDSAIKHGTIKICFTPDEEIGAGADRFDVRKFGADYAYTVDGGELGELVYENFNAAGAKVTVNGVGIHPGSSKNKMVNALLIGMDFNAMLPVFERPMFTEGFEGFYHLHGMHGSVEKAELEYLIRDHDEKRFLQKKKRLEKIASYLNGLYGRGTVQVEIEDSYYNMKEKILPHFHLVETAQLAMNELGIEPLIVPERGGTDGARLSFMGLPCPNLFAGGHNFHGRFEYIPVQSMEKAAAVLVRIAEISAREGI